MLTMPSSPPATARFQHVEKSSNSERLEVLPFVLTKKQYKAYRGKLMQRHPYCSYCGVQLKADSATLDHIEPVSNGGQDSPANLALACERCNRAKDARSVGTWLNHIATSVVMESIEIWLAGNVPYRSKDLADVAADAIESTGAARPDVLVANVPFSVFQTIGGVE